MSSAEAFLCVVKNQGPGLKREDTKAFKHYQTVNIFLTLTYYEQHQLNYREAVVANFRVFGMTQFSILCGLGV